MFHCSVCLENYLIFGVYCGLFRLWPSKSEKWTCRRSSLVDCEACGPSSYVETTSQVHRHTSNMADAIFNRLLRWLRSCGGKYRNATQRLWDGVIGKENHLPMKSQQQKQAETTRSDRRRNKRKQLRLRAARTWNSRGHLLPSLLAARVSRQWTLAPEVLEGCRQQKIKVVPNFWNWNSVAINNRSYFLVSRCLYRFLL